MSAAAFQAAMARLVIDRRFQQRLLATGECALPSSLTPRERKRLLHAARHRGLRITRTMYVSFRLARLQASVPYTFAILGKRRLKAELSLYLESCRPTSFYYIDEGRKLLAHLRGRMRSGALAIPYLADVITYERAMLAMQDAFNRGTDKAVTIRLEHDLAAVIRWLDAGKTPRRISVQPTVIVGEMCNRQIRFCQKGRG